MRNIINVFKNLSKLDKVYAQELIPCPDGTYADPSIGCVTTPGGVVSPESGIADLILQIASGLMGVVAGIAIVTLIVGGIMYATSAGSDEKVQKAKRLMIWSVTGLVIALLARTLAQFLLSSIL